jgi:beta-lactamase class A
MKIWKLAVAVGATLALSASAASAQQKLTFTLNWVAGGDHAPYFYAQKMGWYKDAGVNVDFETGRTVSHLDGEMFAMCSTFKGYAAARVLQMVQRGELTLDQQVFVDQAEVVTYSPVTGPRAGGTMPLAEVCQAAVRVSDNTAGNLMLKTIGGPQAITDFARSIGDDRTRLDRWETELNSAIPGDPRDTTTPHALGTGYRNLLTGDVLAQAHAHPQMRGH